MSSSYSIGSLGLAYFEGNATILKNDGNNGKRFAAFKDIETTNAALRVFTTLHSVFFSPFPELAKMIDSAHTIMDGLVAWGGAENLKAKCQKTEYSHRPMKKIGLALLTATDGYGLLSFLDGMGFIELSKTAAKIGSFLRLPKFITNIPLNAFVFGMATTGFTLLLVDKVKHNVYSNNPVRSDAHAKSRRMKLVGYAIGAIAMSVLCAASAASSGVLHHAAKGICLVNDTFKVGRSMFGEVNKSVIKNKPVTT